MNARRNPTNAQRGRNDRRGAPGMDASLTGDDRWRVAAPSDPPRPALSSPKWRCYAATQVRDGEVLIVDEFSGRVMDGRRWGDGLHQAVEAKEGVEVQAETEIIAQVPL